MLRRSSLRSKLLAVSVIAGFLLAFNGCVKDKGALPKSTGAPCDTVTDIKFTGVISPIINANCAIPGCHVSGGSAPGDFILYADVQAVVNSGAFANRVFVLKDMPPSYSTGPLSLSECDLNKLKAWVNKGAPN